MGQMWEWILRTDEMTMTPARTERKTGRRTLVKGTAWSAPLILTGAPAAHAGISQCTVLNSIQINANQVTNLDAVCQGNSQSPNLNVPRIRVGYGKVWLPTVIEICNCTTDPAWYRFRETDSLSNFQIEVAGRHNDQNSTTAGYRPAFKLNPVGQAGGCQQFPLTYRTSVPRPYYGGSGFPTNASNYDPVAIDIVLQRNPSTSATAPTTGWVEHQTFTVTGRVWRTTNDSIAFGLCTPQSPGRTATVQPRQRTVLGLD